ncbi:hypothetical protein VPHD528_0147 [Vibrio phage D528]
MKIELNVNETYVNATAKDVEIGEYYSMSGSAFYKRLSETQVLSLSSLRVVGITNPDSTVRRYGKNIEVIADLIQMDHGTVSTVKEDVAFSIAGDVNFYMRKGEFTINLETLELVTDLDVDEPVVAVYDGATTKIDINL